MSGNHVSREGYEKLTKELQHLKRVRRRELSKEIGVAREKGDLKENAEYHAAKEAQGLNERKIAELEDKLSNAQILDDTDIPKDQALVGATVKLKDLSSKKEVEYTLVSELEADFSQGKISVTSPVGRGLLGHKVGETVEINIPAGTLKYRLLKITR
ncbi:MAG: transcription elongation factor GreA [Candidatus Omnitrophica bacterium]|nr:transcription elongation factor GreA [Candidatus Omnitrophota bacterium]